ncbi:pyruvate:ferredoxin (flavodoxin) oxidoreductase [Fuerstiella marisgermanici]|uniref:Pyruvate-flavodoxin oxidoreductase n=1 Tax=Fuerstiella marisgermanici TaxID=1891926 RepID=A0A1P8WCF5_9PLAN|nr:pyruvate:ferredoxin (flavodoxin) oxidoreductase [Fuerstiella marisgermanici]APZ91740.1 Pyruvate-flavodoxin oxidoreductase [Fuerstiella marisgermanici]
MDQQAVTIDGNEAAANVAYAVSEVIAIYPITPASPMGELDDVWAARGRKNVFGSVPDVMEMQSEGGAAGTVHGSLQAGALTTTFTASQGLLLMLPNMFKIAGELTPAVFHVAARTMATHALSIFGDHSDVMAARMTGWAMLCSGSVQESHDMSVIAHAATLKSRLPFLHFFDGFRTSHELNKIDLLPEDAILQMMDRDAIRAFRDRALTPDRPVLRGTAQNPDVFFQAREAANPFYNDAPETVQQVMDQFAELTGRSYHLFDYVGADDAERIVVMMGSGSGAAEEAVAAMNAAGEKVGLVRVRLYRPFDVARFVDVIPASVKHIAVLDRTKEPGAVGEPLYQDVVAALAERWAQAKGGMHPMPMVTGGRYGLSSKEFTPAMAAATLDELKQAAPKQHFTVGITDDVTNLSLPVEADRFTESPDVRRSVFYGLGSDGTVGANKNSVKIVGENTPLHAQGYFVYDSKKAGAVTVSHLRFSPQPIQSTYLIQQADFVACHQFQFMNTRDVLSVAEHGATFLLNSSWGSDDVWQHLPQEAQQQILDKQLKFYVIDAYKLARDAGLGGRINTVMQTCFFALADILPKNEAIERIKDAIKKSYGKKGESLIRKNCEAVDQTLQALQEVTAPAAASSTTRRQVAVPDHAPDFVKKVTGVILSGMGDRLPVSALPVDGTFITGTAKFERRSIAQDIPIWDPDICIQCGLCAFVCPHAAIRSKAFEASAVNNAPSVFQTLEVSGKDLPEHRMTIQVAPDDCTGCGVCVEVCPARSKEVAKHKAINMEPKVEHLADERENFEFFLSIPEIDRSTVRHDQIKGTQLLQPLFEYSGACAGCGETPYLKLLTQLFGDRLLIANATGCSSIYGGNLPTTPYATNSEGRGPAWSNSLFEDNAEFGLGMRMAVTHQQNNARDLLQRMRMQVDVKLAEEILNAPQNTDDEVQLQRQRVDILREKLTTMGTADADELLASLNYLVQKSVWIVGGDGWAYDIGFGGLDHVMASNKDVNVLVLDTEVYSNTGGQASKSTPRAAIAKFASGGKTIRKKDLGMIAVDYGHVYVAKISMGSNPNQAIKAFNEAESYHGPSIILAYSPCIAHGIDMSQMMVREKDAVASGYWPLYRYDPRLAHEGQHAFQLDSRKPRMSFREFAQKEARFATLTRTNPQEAERLFTLAQEDIKDQWNFYEQMAGMNREIASVEG